MLASLCLHVVCLFFPPAVLQKTRLGSCYFFYYYYNTVLNAEGGGEGVVLRAVTK